MYQQSYVRPVTCRAHYAWAVVSWLDEEEMRAWRGLIEVFHHLDAALEDELLAAQGLTNSDYAVLVNLSEAVGHRLRMCDLAARMHLTPSGLTRRIDSLVKQGFVARQPAADDRRVSFAVLTTKGLNKLERAAPVHVGSVRRHMLDKLSRNQIRQLGSVLAALKKRWEQDDGL